MPELDKQLLLQVLSLSALVGGTAQYAGLLRHREDARSWAAWKAEADRTGLQGLVRLFAADDLVTRADAIVATGRTHAGDVPARVESPSPFHDREATRVLRVLGPRTAAQHRRAGQRVSRRAVPDG
ncbi:MAG: hypothetical protein H0W17_05520 [Chloroflexi bacterium]|nr:hypothetical protein [Chloroflexota bacterium]